MSTATISIDSPENLIVGSQDLAASGAITKDIMIRNTNAAGVIRMKMNGDSSGAVFQVRNKNDNSQFKAKANGEYDIESTISGIIDPTVIAGSRGDIQFAAVSDDGLQQSILIRLHYDAVTPLLQIKGQMIDWKKPVVVNNSSNVQYTASALIGGCIERDVDGVTRLDTFPNANDLVTAINEASVGTTFDVTIKNTETRLQANIANVIDLQNGVGMTWNTTDTPSVKYIDTQSSRTFRVRITNVTALSEAYTVYHLASHNTLKADGYTSVWKATGAAGEVISLDTTARVLPLLLNATAMDVNDRKNIDPCKFETVSVGANQGIKYIGRDKVTVEVISRLYCQVKNTDESLVVSLMVSKNGALAPPIASTKIESYPCAQITASSIIGPIDFGDILSARIQSAEVKDVDCYSCALSVQIIS